MGLGRGAVAALPQWRGAADRALACDTAAARRGIVTIPDAPPWTPYARTN